MSERLMRFGSEQPVAVFSEDGEQVDNSWKVVTGENGEDYYEMRGTIVGIPVATAPGIPGFLIQAPGGYLSPSPQAYTLEQIYALRNRATPEPEPTGRFRHLDWEDEAW